MKLNLIIALVFYFFFVQITSAQNDSLPPQEEEDYSQYENVETDSKDKETKVFCSPKIFDVSPFKFASLGYDYMHQYSFKSSGFGSFNEDDKLNDSFQNTKTSTNGIRLLLNIPVISKTNLLWQIGGNYIRSNYHFNELNNSSDKQKFIKSLNENGLTNLNLNTTIFKPLGTKTFVIVQLTGELNGNFSLNSSTNSPDIKNTKGSYSFIWGKRPHDRLQWGVGMSRTFKAGELNYIPVVLYNYTSLNRKWGTEIILPSKAFYRRKFTPRSMLLTGYELEGTSYRLKNVKQNQANFELRRSELRFKLDYQRQLKGFIWCSLQAGAAYNLNYNVDDLGNSNKEFFRGFFGKQKYAMLNEIGIAPFVNISINFVSP